MLHKHLFLFSWVLPCGTAYLFSIYSVSSEDRLCINFSMVFILWWWSNIRVCFTNFRSFLVCSLRGPTSWRRFVLYQFVSSQLVCCILFCVTGGTVNREVSRYSYFIVPNYLFSLLTYTTLSSYQFCVHRFPPITSHHEYWHYFVTAWPWLHLWCRNIIIYVVEESTSSVYDSAGHGKCW